MVYNHSSDIDIKNFMNLCGKCTAKPFSFLDNASHVRKYLLERT